MNSFHTNNVVRHFFRILLRVLLYSNSLFWKGDTINILSIEKPLQSIKVVDFKLLDYYYRTSSSSSSSLRCAHPANVVFITFKTHFKRIRLNWIGPSCFGFMTITIKTNNNNNSQKGRVHTHRMVRSI